ncbi:MAG: T9SS type A sorting domain-containing protein, partial [Flavobacteriales bacterium]|nr:T9SS type A sorting domain-containing protein [Flavobacteriales bacterium]
MTRTLTLAGALVAFGGSHAQFITLHHGEEVVPNGSTYVVEGPADAQVLEVHLTATLAEDSGRTVNVKRYELSVQPGTANYFCWYLCYGAVEAGSMPLWAAPNQHSLAMEPGVPLDNFAAYHEPWEIVGSNSYRYVLYDIVQPDDSVWVDIVFNSLATGVHEQALVRTFQVFPNPSMGQDVAIAVELGRSARNTAIAVYDMLGSRLRSMRLAPAQSRIDLEVQDMAPGVYFAT